MTNIHKVGYATYTTFYISSSTSLHSIYTINNSYQLPLLHSIYCINNMQLPAPIHDKSSVLKNGYLTRSEAYLPSPWNPLPTLYIRCHHLSLARQQSMLIPALYGIIGILVAKHVSDMISYHEKDKYHIGYVYSQLY